ncbi:hypothetical protein PIB30_088879, partial [Stylosanthes scabra]|nr:hypothetical protein [Stylosanthes scabra]
PDLPQSRYCSLCGFHAPPHGFTFDKSMDDSQSLPRPLVKMRLTRERYPHPYKECFVPSPTDAGLTFHPLGEPSVLAGAPIRAPALLSFVTAQTSR